MEELSFALEVVDGWPPVAVEHVWCEKVGATYKLKNAPFFIHGLACGDRFTADPDPINGCIFEFKVVEPSGHSLVWVMERGDINLSECRSRLSKLGCNIEGFPAFRLHAVDVPASVDATAINAAVNELEALGFALAFPVWRHELNVA